MNGYRALKQRLTHEFMNDAHLTREIAAATSVDAIVAALGASYTAALSEAAAAAADPTARFHVEGAERAAAAREAVILEMLAFFQREQAATADIEVRRTGPQGLRVVCRQPHSPGQPPAR